MASTAPTETQTVTAKSDRPPERLVRHVFWKYPLLSVVLLALVAIIAAITLTLRRRAGYKQQNISAQVAVRAADRLRVVKMDPEPRP